MVKKRKIMTALVLAVVMVAGNAMSAFAETRTASGRGHVLQADEFAQATIITNTAVATMIGEGSVVEPGGNVRNVYGNVKITYSCYINSMHTKKKSGTVDNVQQIGSEGKDTETETYTQTLNGGSVINCSVITYVGLSKNACNTTGAVAQIVY